LLSARYCTIVVRGAALEPVANLEVRAESGYSTMVLELVEAAALRPGESLLDVGCGSGALVRRLCRDTAGREPGRAPDLNPFLLGEAEALARQEGLDAGLSFRVGNAEALPLPDSSFDVVVCSTVLEEADADTVMAELRRVTRPGGRVAVVVRAIDRPQW